MNWCDYTTVLAEQRGPLIRARLQGLAKSMADQLQNHVLRQGEVHDFHDGRGAVLRTGVEILLKILEGRFKEFDIETQINAQDALDTFRRLPGEDVDSTLARYELVRDQAYQRARHIKAPCVETRQLFQIFNIPSTAQLRLLANTQGNLPANEQQLIELKAHIRREAHWIDSHGTGRGIHGATSTQSIAAQGRTFVATPADFSDPWMAERNLQEPAFDPTSANLMFQAGVQAAATMFSTRTTSRTRI